jgi:hypothetical protein
MLLRRIFLLKISLIAVAVVAGCSSDTTTGFYNIPGVSGVFNQNFNVAGHWSGTIYGECFSGGQDPISMTLSQNGTSVSGVLLSLGLSTSIKSGTLTGEAVQNPSGGSGDNPLTADNEGSNVGTLYLELGSAQATGGVSSVTVTNGGSGYTSEPKVSFIYTGVGGGGAKAISVISEGEVIGVVVTNPGSGFVSPPSVIFSGGGGSGAIATAAIDTAVVTNILTFALAGTSQKLSGHYSGIWQCCGLADCGDNSRGVICLSRTGLCPPP